MKDLTLYGVKGHLIKMPGKPAVICFSCKKKKFLGMYAQLGKKALRDPENNSAVRDGRVMDLHMVLHSGRDDHHVPVFHPMGGIGIKHGHFSFQEKIELVIIMGMGFYIAEIAVFVIVDLEILRDHILPVQKYRGKVIYHAILQCETYAGLRKY